MYLRFLVYFGLLAGLFLPTAKAEPLTALVLQTSLNEKDSRSDLLGDILFDKAIKAGFKVQKISLKDFPLPLSNGHEGSAFDDKNVKTFHDKIKQAQVILVAFPIYNYAVSAATKNVFELTSHPHKNVLSGDAWMGKVVGLAGASGSSKSMLAPLGFAGSLITDQKCHVIPHIAIAINEDFKEKEPSKELSDRLDKMIDQAKRLGAALS